MLFPPFSARHVVRAFACSAVMLLAACGNSQSSVPVSQAAIAGTTGGVAIPVADPASLVLKAETALPPGQSGFVSTAGQAQGSASGNPADYGAHIDDQRALYWSFKAKPATLGTKPGTPTSPKAGVQVYRDSYGVPIIYAGNVKDLWYGVGYSIAQDRLFLMDAVRRTAQGTLAELTGCGAVPADLQQRLLTYTAAEYQSFFDKLTPDAKDAVQGYVDGANAWVASLTTSPDQLPAEYGLLSSQPQPFTVQDVLASGVYITRFVAAEGGNEYLNIAMLQKLTTRYGSARAGKDAFLDLNWQDDAKAVTTIPVSAGTFSNHPAAPEGRDAVFEKMADWAVGLPDSLRRGDGTGNSAKPAPCSQPSLPVASNSSSGLMVAGTREVTVNPLPHTVGEGWGGRRPQSLSHSHERVRQDSKRLRAIQSNVHLLAAAPSPTLPRHAGEGAAGQDAQHKIIIALAELRAYLHGGSHAYALAPSRTRDGGTLLVSGPQLGYGYPLLLVEYEIHGAGYDARGSSVPILPVVGIGYTDNTAWGLTTGYSKTIDSFIETTCSTAQIAAGTCKANQYFHNGVWKDMACRAEVFKYRAAQSGLPVGPASLSQTNTICRTVHGPVVARDDAKGMARSLSYSMWMREIETIEGIRNWNKAKTFAEFDAAMRQVTWNENTTVATRDGHIAYYHPGLHFARNPETDQRFPVPGTGEFDHAGLVSFEQTPHIVDPAQGYLANWNTKPAVGWLDGEGLGNTSRPGGPGQRVTSILNQLGARRDWTFADLMTIDRLTGTTDPRANEYLPVLRSFRSTADAQLDATQKAALDLVLNWDRAHYGPNIDITNSTAKDGPAATIFGELVTALRDELFADLKGDVIDTGTPDADPNNPTPAAGLTTYGRVSGVGSHVFDQSVLDNVTVRVLAPASSAIVNRHDWSKARNRDAVVLAALKTALSRMATTYNSGTALTPATLANCTRVHPRSQLCSLTGVIGPGSTTPSGSCVTMPYQDRGSWLHRIGYEKP